ncbi:type I glyceraldehyde-3-phosphate dehydrogenase [Gluconobacter roseus]|uniref:Glyceraldehyde-3-phosphate dehydrogenase n=1 Tax=Gluconobacter roseus NBRC 3990 TaxID=1307950 RepID=A0A4Y3MAG4_9PROT|nr:type I glyceraldehyde-3-phosphate dehydrogenase [Gluconobacter roseus]KXV43968.1 glyceraldehyde-3-phosphate dehydrogenase [Gluconobacter roseus]GBR48319.1 glyceraldehyde 3-phosphate dehydrogenase [Gluconobacter roseus NBRC 3990]GEB03329.1 glyceraldehyde-3-phosphate dehydrogenase [Gluconobacter roseus NBRC 3990]GLP93787.1 glyceraldehyde-3-phosphate dehydrogenase [Gluconobacter roseus NBRC 3990]
MAVKIGINGFGRIGRLTLRSIIESGRTDIVPVVINGPGSVEDKIHMFVYDSIHGRFPGKVELEGDQLTIHAQGRTYGPIRVSSERDPAAIHLDDVDVVMECSGLFTSKEAVAPLLQAGARKVLISAPASDVDATIVYGVNNDVLKPDMTVVSNGSCTTNCLAPLVKVADEAFGVECGYMLTVHSYTGDQQIVDRRHRDLRRARAGGLNMVPTSTGAAKAIGLVLPHLKGRLVGSSLRVPTPNVSMVALDFLPTRAPATVDEVNAVFHDAAAGALAGILDYSDGMLVSSDFNHSPASSSFDATQTALIHNGEMVHICSWYDNEWGFSNRMIDTAVLMGTL